MERRDNAERPDWTRTPQADYVYERRYSRRLSAAAHRLYTAIRSYLPPTGEPVAEVSYPRLMAHMGLADRHAITNHIPALEREGLLHRDGKGPHGTNRYRLRRLESEYDEVRAEEDALSREFARGSRGSAQKHTAEADSSVQKHTAKSGSSAQKHTTPDTEECAKPHSTSVQNHTAAVCKSTLSKSVRLDNTATAESELYAMTPNHVIDAAWWVAGLSWLTDQEAVRRAHERFLAYYLKRGDRQDDDGWLAKWVYSLRTDKGACKPGLSDVAEIRRQAGVWEARSRKTQQDADREYQELLAMVPPGVTNATRLF